ncbi:MAG: hypothetical protein Q9222_006495 [Ikaeria aurantiellina]
MASVWPVPFETRGRKANIVKHGVPRTGGLKGSTGQNREVESRKIREYRALVEIVNTKMRNKEYTNDVLSKTTELLELNPEYYTVWNYRRLLLRSFFTSQFRPDSNPTEEPSDSLNLDNIQRYIANDLSFLLPLLRQYPKCYWIWNYRFWLLEEASRLLPSTTAYDFWQKELALVGKMLSLDGRNFHGWGYRRKVIAALEKLSSSMESTGKSMTESEFEYTTKMVESNLSNFSAWHRRSKLLPKLLDEKKADQAERRKALDRELGIVQRALWADPDSKDQSLWFYHQYLISNFDSRPQSDVIAPDLSVEHKIAYIKAQIEDLYEMLEGAETCKWIYQRLLELSLMSRSLANRWAIDSARVEECIEQLLILDPLREGRWQDLRERIAS